MRRITIPLALILVAGGLLAAPAGAHGATVAARSVQADFNHDGADDLAVGVPSEDVGSTHDAGAVNVLYGTAGGAHRQPQLGGDHPHRPTGPHELHYPPAELRIIGSWHASSSASGRASLT